MLCLNCGKETAGTRQYCSNCSNAEAAAERKSFERKNSYAQNSNNTNFLNILLSSYFLPIAGGVSILSAFIIYILWPSGPLPLETNSSQVILGKQSSGHKIEYLKQGPINVDGVVIYSNIKRWPDTFGTKVEIGYLTNQSVKEIEAQRSKKGGCISSYWNAHVKRMYLIPKDKEEYNNLKSLSLAKGDIVQASGERLSFQKGKKGKIVWTAPASRNFILTSKINKKPGNFKNSIALR